MVKEESLNDYDDLQLAAVLDFDGWLRELVRRFLKERRPIAVRVEAAALGRLSRNTDKDAAARCDALRTRLGSRYASAG